MAVAPADPVLMFRCSNVPANSLATKVPAPFMWYHLTELNPILRDSGVQPNGLDECLKLRDKRGQVDLLRDLRHQLRPSPWKRTRTAPIL